MADKDIQFLTAEEAIRRVFVDLVGAPDGWLDCAMFARVYSFLTEEDARPATCLEKCPELTKLGSGIRGRR